MFSIWISVYEPERTSHINPTLANDYYQIELNVDEDDVSAEMQTEPGPLADDEKHFQIVSVQSLNMETEDADESSKNLESPLDEPNHLVEMSTFGIENTEKSHPACNTQLDENHSSAFKYLEKSSDKQSNEMEDCSSTPSSSQAIGEEENRNISNNPEVEEDYGLEKESSTEGDNHHLKKINNIRDVFDSDSD